MTDFSFVVVQTQQHYAAVSELFMAYAAGLDFDLEFQNFATELKQLPQMYGPPDGAIVLAQYQQSYIACAGLRALEPGIAELKRIYVTPEQRGRGIGKLLAEYMIKLAQQCNYQSLRLDTMVSMSAALKLYRELGFKPIPAYRYNPLPDAIYLELSLQ